MYSVVLKSKFSSSSLSVHWSWTSNLHYHVSGYAEVHPIQVSLGSSVSSRNLRVNAVVIRCEWQAKLAYTIVWHCKFVNVKGELTSSKSFSEMAKNGSKVTWTGLAFPPLQFGIVTDCTHLCNHFLHSSLTFSMRKNSSVATLLSSQTWYLNLVRSYEIHVGILCLSFDFIIHREN